MKTAFSSQPFHRSRVNGLTLVSRLAANVGHRCRAGTPASQRRPAGGISFFRNAGTRCRPETAGCPPNALTGGAAPACHTGLQSLPDCRRLPWRKHWPRTQPRPRPLPLGLAAHPPTIVPGPYEAGVIGRRLALKCVYGSAERAVPPLLRPSP
jgi:hypothetical protein